MRTWLSPLLSALYLLITFSSCQDNQEKQVTSGGLSDRGRSANIQKAATYNLITIEVGTPREQLIIEEEHLHGRFFKDRAEFYVVEKPEMFISNTLVKELTLYFIDGILCKKKYALANDISSELMKSYGSFKFLPLNPNTRTIIQKEPVVIKTPTGNVLNDKLDRYEMKWYKEEVLIKYGFSEDSVTTDIFLVEELSAYKYLLDAAERDII